MTEELDGETAKAILAELDDLHRMMRPHYCAHPSMDGKYPNWSVWLPKEGRTSRKTLTEAVIDAYNQTRP